jgi:hypothetical protein
MSIDELQAQIEEYGVHPILGPVGLGWNIEQNPRELAIFLDAIPGVKTVLEIGTGPNAGLSRFLSEVLGWTVTTVDKNGPWVVPAGVRLIKAQSIDAYPQVKDNHYDLVIIDADHHYEAVKRDYELYAPLGHIVMMHDINGLRDCEGAQLFWQEIAYAKNKKRRRNHFEVIEPGEQGAGIGWIINE